MFQILSDFPDDVLAVRASGTLTPEDYDTVLVPALEARLISYRPLKVLIHLGPDFEGVKTSAMVEDARLGLHHLKDWGRIAIVTDVGWIRDMTNLFRMVLKRPLKVFFNADYAQAKAWICLDEESAKRLAD